MTLLASSILALSLTQGNKQSWSKATGGWQKRQVVLREVLQQICKQPGCDRLQMTVRLLNRLHNQPGSAIFMPLPPCAPCTWACRLSPSKLASTPSLRLWAQVAKLWWHEIVVVLRGVAPHLAILRYYRCNTSYPATPFQRGSRSPKIVWCSRLVLSSRRHICAIPHFATYLAVIVWYPPPHKTRRRMLWNYRYKQRAIWRASLWGL